MSFRQKFQDAFMIKKILVVHTEKCNPVFEIDLKSEIEIDPSMICDELETGTLNQIQETLGTTEVFKIQYYSFTVLTSMLGPYTVYLFAEAETSPIVEAGVLELAKWFNVILGYDGVEWKGPEEIQEYFKESIIKKVMELFSIWMLYPLEVNREAMKRIFGRNELQRKIMSYFKEKKNITSVKLLDELIMIADEEEILANIYDLVEQDFLRTGTTDEYTQTFFEMKN
ncbi:MAG: hypothetical protein H7641_07570 [Candidatus Heimdallarchaeota archaeon]|nr:hypothetical protein [Candidatus Heimdallarchaeota archaeon]MCK4877422.1 hypothetical protein [Candidatus Heimdallarchaeota archaeon]